MKTVATAVGAILTAFAGTALADLDAGSAPRLQKVWHTWDTIDERVFGDTRRPHECWNPRARHYEAVRPGEYQPDLDFSRCRRLDAPIHSPYYYEREPVVVAREECWNPRAGHYEENRPGEYQNDLDYSRCRIVRQGGPRYVYR